MMEYLHWFCILAMCIFTVLLINLISAEIILDLSFSVIAKVLHPHNDTGNAKVFYVFQTSLFLNLTGF